MSRYRPPRTAGTALITPEGEARMRAEFHELWHVRRPQVTQSVSEAAAQGDRSENAEYIYRKKQLGEIDRRIRYLSKRLQELRIIESAPTDPSAIYFGAWLRVESDDGVAHDYRIVGPDETDAALGWISIDSPLARAALGKRADDEFEADLPTGRTGFVVVRVSYDEAPDER